MEGPFDRVAVDCLGPFPATYSNNWYIVIFTDYLTRWPEGFAVSDVEATMIAELLVDHILARHGAPRTLLSDRGANFLFKLVLAVCDITHTKKLNTTAYYPQCDAVVERYNSTIAQSLLMHVDNNLKTWDTFLNLYLFAYWVLVHPTMRETPFYMLYGCKQRLPLDVTLMPPENLSPSVATHHERIITNLQRAQAITHKNTQRVQQAMKSQYDKNAKEANFQIGDRVWVYTLQLKKGLSKKLLHFWHGRCRIIQNLSPVNY